MPAWSRSTGPTSPACPRTCVASAWCSSTTRSSRTAPSRRTWASACACSGRTEPLGARDKKLRDHMKIELKRLQREVGITTIYVTHDQEEALTMSDRIAVIHRGRVEQVAAPRGLYETPATAFVAGFIGNINLLAGRAAGANAVACGGATLAATGAAPAGAVGASALRPERVRLDPAGAMDTLLTMTVAHVVYQGETVRYILRSDAGLELQALELGEVRYAAGARVRAGWAAADARMIEDDIRREEIA